MCQVKKVYRVTTKQKYSFVGICLRSDENSCLFLREDGTEFNVFSCNFESCTAARISPELRLALTEGANAVLEISRLKAENQELQKKIRIKQDELEDKYRKIAAAAGLIRREDFVHKVDEILCSQFPGHYVAVCSWGPIKFSFLIQKKLTNGLLRMHTRFCIENMTTLVISAGTSPMTNIWKIIRPVFL